MRILHIDSGREMRGGQYQALRLHQGLLESGHESMLLARENSPLAAAAKKANLPCDVLRPLRLPLLSRSFDILHAHDSHSHTLAALFSRVPFAVSRRVAFPVRQSAASNWKYRRAALYLSVSRHVAAQLQNAGIAEDRIAIVYDGVPVPAEPAGGTAVLIPHTLDPEKGMGLALDAARIAKTAIQVSTDLANDLPHACALVYLTYSEGLGSGILLAMAHGVTVIASNVGGVPELIDDGVNGILVPNDVNAVAAALHHIHPSLGQAARITIMERFTERHMIEGTLAAYHRIVNE
jgi:hypothetical protein